MLSWNTDELERSGNVDLNAGPKERHLALRICASAMMVGPRWPAAVRHQLLQPCNKCRCELGDIMRLMNPGFTISIPSRRASWQTASLRSTKSSNLRVNVNARFSLVELPWSSGRASSRCIHCATHRPAQWACGCAVNGTFECQAEFNPLWLILNLSTGPFPTFSGRFENDDDLV
jgi:hypothetical protein